MFHNQPMNVEEIKGMLRRTTHNTVIRLIAQCSNRQQQQSLIHLWNDPWKFEEFLQQAAGIGCAYME